jgi:Xaa-Pro dipeptidase
VDTVAQSLLQAQDKAAALFDAVVSSGMIQAKKLESELSTEIHALARAQFGCRRHWHKRIVRAGPNAMLTYHDEPADRLLAEDDIIYLDFGPVFEEWEADFGRTYVLGSDPVKHRLTGDLAVAFQQGKELFERTPDLTTGELYDYMVGFGRSAGWEFGGPTAGH